MLTPAMTLNFRYETLFPPEAVVGTVTLVDGAGPVAGGGAFRRAVSRTSATDVGATVTARVSLLAFPVGTLRLAAGAVCAGADEVLEAFLLCSGSRFRATVGVLE